MALRITTIQIMAFIFLFTGFRSYSIAGQIVQTVEAEAALVSPTLDTVLNSGNGQYENYSGWTIDSGSSLVINSAESISSGTNCPLLTFSGLTQNTEYTVCAWLAYAPSNLTSPAPTGWKLRYSFVSSADAKLSSAPVITPAKLFNPGFRPFQLSAMNRYVLGVKTSDADGKINVWLGRALYNSGLTASYIGWDKFDIISVNGKISDSFPLPEEVYIDAATTLQWMTDYRATKHDVYVGDDYNDVLNATTVPIDKDNNNFIDMNDLAYFVQDWLCDTPPCPCDFNSDSNTNFIDFSILAQSWLKPPIYRGRIAVNTLAVSDLSDGVYYWRVDEVNNTNVVLAKGTVHRFTVARYSVRPEDYGAIGNGIIDDTNAFQQAASAIESASGGQLVLTSGKTYRVGKQIHVPGQYPYYQPQPIFSVKNTYKRKTAVLGNGATMKANDGLRFGSFDPTNGAVYNPTTSPFTDWNYCTSAYWGMLRMDDCDGVEIRDVTLDGNIDNLTLGGYYGYPQGRECGAYGILMSRNNNVTIYDVNSSNHGCDGIGISWEGLTTYDPPKPHYMENVKCYYNSRQGLSFTGGNALTVVNSKFNHQGKKQFATSPSAGLDIEATLGVCRNAQFTNCDFVDNSGIGVTMGSGDNADSTFTDCLFWGTTTVSLLTDDPGVVLTNCDIYGSTYAWGYNSDANKVTKYTNCHFEDYTGAYEGVTYSSYNGEAALIVASWATAPNPKFENCTIVANATRAFWLENSVSPVRILKNCDVYHKYSGLANAGYQSLIDGSYLEDVRFHESGLGTNNYFIQPRSVTIGPGVTVDGPMCRWQSTSGPIGTITPGSY